MFKISTLVNIKLNIAFLFIKWPLKHVEIRQESLDGKFTSIKLLCTWFHDFSKFGGVGFYYIHHNPWLLCVRLDLVVLNEK